MVRIRLWADIPLDKAASGLEVEIPLPAHVTRVHCEVDQPGAAALQVCASCMLLPVCAEPAVDVIARCCFCTAVGCYC